MLLQYLDINSPLMASSHADYSRMHETFVGAYKALYDDVALFSLLPEKFISEADPVIQRYMDNITIPSLQPVQRQNLQLITGFIERFYLFTDAATEMFTDHQALAEQTVLYLQQLAQVKQQEGGMEKSYLHFMAQLERLTGNLSALQQNVNFLKKELEQLRPVWAMVVERI